MKVSDEAIFTSDHVTLRELRAERRVVIVDPQSKRRRDRKVSYFRK